MGSLTVLEGVGSRKALLRFRYTDVCETSTPRLSQLMSFRKGRLIIFTYLT